jgi:hypothetical protein
MLVLQPAVQLPRTAKGAAEATCLAASLLGDSALLTKTAECPPAYSTQAAWPSVPSQKQILSDPRIGMDARASPVRSRAQPRALNIQKRRSRSVLVTARFETLYVILGGR